MHGSTHVGGWTAKQIHQAVQTTFHLSDKAYSLNQLRYDLRKLKGHGLLERDGNRYAYRLTLKGVQVALLLLFLPTAASTIDPILSTDPTAASRPPTIAPTRPSNTSGRSLTPPSPQAASAS